jgi:hypothetical protein
MSYLYLLTNEAIPGYIKIGLTENTVSERIIKLDNTWHLSEVLVIV